MEFFDVLALLSTGLSTGAVLIALRTRKIRSIPKARFEAIELRQSDLDDRVESAVTNLNKVTQRLRMRAVRSQETPQEPADPVTQRSDESDAEWKARMRKAIATGTIDPRRH